MTFSRTAAMAIATCMAFVLTAEADTLRWKKQFQAMGTHFAVTIFCDDERKAEIVLSQAEEEVIRLNRIFSDYLDDSEVTKLSKAAGNEGATPISRELWDVLKFAQELSVRTDGVFDVTIGPLSRLWRRAFRRDEMPDSSAVADNLSLVKHQNLSLQHEMKAAYLTKPGMRIDLGGIAKGYTMDVLADLIRGQGVHRFLIDAGGDLLAGEAPPGKKGWDIALSGTADAQGNIRKVVLVNKALATSGTTYRFIEHKGLRYGHIINPKTGYGINSRHNFAVMADDGMTADALATTLAIMGSVDFGQVCATYDGCEILYFERKAFATK